MPVLTESERVGTTVGGKYRLDRIIGRGGVGTVFAGVHAWTGRDVAVKMLHVQYAEDRAVVDRFLVEARASATLRHPNVVDVLDMGKDDDGAVYMVLEYLEGESLSRRLERRGRLKPDETAAILLPVMDALAEAHDLGIVHRDIKPENVFIALDGKRRTVPKLLDFGIAKVLAAGSARATRTGTVVGTPAYMSPEQADGRSEVGPASDVWSMGVLLYECLSGGLPFPSDSPTATLVAILTTSPPPLRAVLPDVPVPLANAVDRALSRAPSDRWPDMRAFSGAILSAVGAAALQRPDPSGAFQPSDPAHDVVVAAPTPARAVAATERMPAVSAHSPVATHAAPLSTAPESPRARGASSRPPSEAGSSSRLPVWALALGAVVGLVVVAVGVWLIVISSTTGPAPVVVTDLPTPMPSHSTPSSAVPTLPVQPSLPVGSEPPSVPPTPPVPQTPTTPSGPPPERRVTQTTRPAATAEARVPRQAELPRAAPVEVVPLAGTPPAGASPTSPVVPERAARPPGPVEPSQGANDSIIMD